MTVKTSRILLVLLLLSGCAGVNYDSPGERKKIKDDLGIHKDVKVSALSFCDLPFGSRPLCSATPGVGVLTSDAVFLADYSGGQYRKAEELSASDVQCVSEGDGQRFYAFTHSKAVMLFPYSSGSTVESVSDFRNGIVKLLLGRGQPYLTGSSATMIRQTGKKEYGATSVNIGNGPVIVGTSFEVSEVFNPCPVAKP